MSRDSYIAIWLVPVVPDMCVYYLLLTPIQEQSVRFEVECELALLDLEYAL